MDVLKNSFLLILILVGFLIRLSLITLPGFKIDVDDWFAWSARLNEVGFSKFYSNQIFSDYTPGYMYILSFLGYLRNLLQINDQVFFLLLKLPAIVAEVTLGALVYRYSKFASLFIFLNPALIFNSSIWGQVDAILALFLFLVIYYLKKKSLTLSSILLGVAFLMKPQTIAIFPIYTLFIFRNFATKNLLKLSIPFLLIVFIFSLPFFPEKAFTKLFNLILNTANQYPYSSINTYNFWGIFGFWIPDNYLWSNISLQDWGYILLFGNWIMLGYFYLRGKLSLYSLATLATLSFFFLPTRVHERYLYPAIPFLVLTAASLKSRLIWMLTGCLSLIHFLNLYYVYVYYNEFYLKLPKLLYNPLLYNFLDSNGKILSLISTSIFILISIAIIRSYANLKEN